MKLLNFSNLKLSVSPVQQSWLEHGRRGLYVHFKLDIGHFELKISNGSLQPWSHFRVHRIQGESRFSFEPGRHIVAGRISIIWGYPGLEQVQVCSECSNGTIEVVSAGDECWNVCQDCRTIEGQTHYITRAELEAM